MNAHVAQGREDVLYLDKKENGRGKRESVYLRKWLHLQKRLSKVSQADVSYRCQMATGVRERGDLQGVKIREALQAARQLLVDDFR